MRSPPIQLCPLERSMTASVRAGSRPTRSASASASAAPARLIAASRLLTSLVRAPSPARSPRRNTGSASVAEQRGVALEDRVAAGDHQAHRSGARPRRAARHRRLDPVDAERVEARGDRLDALRRDRRAEHDAGARRRGARRRRRRRTAPPRSARRRRRRRSPPRSAARAPPASRRRARRRARASASRSARTSRTATAWPRSSRRSAIARPMLPTPTTPMRSRVIAAFCSEAALGCAALPAARAAQPRGWCCACSCFSRSRATWV